MVRFLITLVAFETVALGLLFLAIETIVRRLTTIEAALVKFHIDTEEDAP